MMVLWLILLCRIAGLCDCSVVYYELSANNLRSLPIGASLTITLKRVNASKAGLGLDNTGWKRNVTARPGGNDTELELKLLQTNDRMMPVPVFRYSPSKRSCFFEKKVYHKTGTIVKCDPINNHYVIRFHPVTAANFGYYYIYKKRQNLKVESSVEISSTNMNVVEGRAAHLKCSVSHNLPVTFTWIKTKESYKGYKGPPSKCAAGGAINHQYRLLFRFKSWESWNIWTVSRRDTGYYHCTARSQDGCLPSERVRLEVFYAATTLTLTANNISLSTGNTLTLRCTSIGGWPDPGLVIYDATSNKPLKQVSERWTGSKRTLTLKRLVQESDNGAKYVCRTRVRAKTARDIPVRESNIVTLIVNIPSNDHFKKFIFVGNVATSGLSIMISVVTVVALCACVRKLQKRLNWAQTPKIANSTQGFSTVTIQRENARNLNILYFNYNGHKYTAVCELADDVNDVDTITDSTKYHYARIPTLRLETEEGLPASENEEGLLALRIAALPRPPAISDIEVIEYHDDGTPSIAHEAEADIEATENEGGYLAMRRGLPRPPAISDIDVIEFHYDDIPTPAQGPEEDDRPLEDEAGYILMAQSSEENRNPSS